MSEPTVDFESKTDKLEVLTHLTDKFLHEAGGKIVLQNARTQVLERLDELDGGDELDAFDENDYDRFVEEKKEFVTSEDALGKTITDVTLVGNIPIWLEQPDTTNTGNEAATSSFSFGESTAQQSEDDFSQLDCLTEHQPEALKEEGYNTFADIWQADLEDLTEVPGIRMSDAKTLQDQASQNVDATKAIVWDAYQRESGNTGSTVLGDNGVVESGAEAHKLTSVKVPAGEPRNPDVYDDTPIPCHAHGLLALKPPTLTPGVVEDYIEEVDDLPELLATLRTLSEFKLQEDATIDAIKRNVETLSGLQQEINERPERVNEWLTQPGIEADTLQAAIDEHSTNVVHDSNIVTIVNDIDREYSDSVPEQTRLSLIYEMRKILREKQDMTALADDAIVEELVAETASPVEVDHPFIYDLEDFPELRTRTLETGETDVELIARIVGKNTYAVDLVGHAGVGKDTILKVLAAATNRPIKVINMDNSVIANELYGDHTINEEGHIVFEDGVFPHGAKYGFWVVISEVNAAPPGILSTLHQAFEKDATIHVKQSDEMISPSPQFRLATTRNPPTEDYGGMDELNSAFADRLNPVEIGYLNKEQEVELIDEMANDNRKIVTTDQIESLVEMANTFRNNADNPRSHFPRLTPRKLVQIIDKYDGPKDDLAGAAKETIRPMLPAEARGNGGSESVMNRIEDHF